MKAANSLTTWPRLKHFPVPGKVLVTAVLCSIAIGLMGAIGQILLHDILPTFYKSSPAGHINHSVTKVPVDSRGDLFADSASRPQAEQPKPFYESDQFVWTLKWTHIHLFGMNIIFIFVGFITAFLDLSSRTKSWLIALPFIGILIDIAGVWLKGYVSPRFFWLHIPGGGLFGVVFIFVFARAAYEMWGSSSQKASHSDSFNK